MANLILGAVGVLVVILFVASLCYVVRVRYLLRRRVLGNHGIYVGPSRWSWMFFFVLAGMIEVCFLIGVSQWEQSSSAKIGTAVAGVVWVVCLLAGIQVATVCVLLESDRLYVVRGFGRRRFFVSAQHIGSWQTIYSAKSENTILVKDRSGKRLFAVEPSWNGYSALMAWLKVMLLGDTQQSVTDPIVGWSTSIKA